MNGLQAAFTGRLGRDPERHYTRGGKLLVVLNVAVDEHSRQTQQQPEAQETTWVKVTCWEELGEQLEPVLKKGTPIFAEGRLRLEKWQSADGQPRSGLALSAWTIQPLQLSRRQRSEAPAPSEARDPADLEALPF
jgi:single-strand DNA-binding protein